MAQVMQRQDEVRETFAQEGVRHEQAFILKTPEGPILIYAVQAEDQAAARAAFEKSALPIDQEHKSILDLSLGERPDVELVYDCEAEVAQMASTATRIDSASSRPGTGEVSLIRLYVLRAVYLLLVVGLAAINLPELIAHEPMARGVIPSLLGAIWLLAFVGLRYPLQMLPLLIFEFVWKAIWLFDYGIPQWSSGHLPPTFAGDLQAIAGGPILFAIVIPWGYVYRHYFRRPADRWK
jgi:hypothetical protein